MKAQVTVVNSSVGMARAETANQLAIFFRLPKENSVGLRDELDVDLERLDVVQDARNLTTGKAIRLKIGGLGVADLRLPDRRIQLADLSRRRGG
jgi:hypothetical protein